MSWGGARPGAGRKPLPPEQRKDRKRLPSARPTKAAAPKAESLPDGSYDLHSVARVIEAMNERSRSRQRRPEINPFQVPRFPKIAIHPDKRHQLALDEAVNWAATEWAGGYLDGVAAEGLLFLGYAYLSELAQRPEYRTPVETIATEMTRKWIKFSANTSGTNASDKKRQEKETDIQSTGEVDQEAKAQAEGKKPRGDKQASATEARIKELVDFMDDLKVRDHFCTMAEQDGFFGRTHLYLDSGADDEELKTPITAVAQAGSRRLARGKLGKGWLKGLRVIEPVWAYPTTYNATNPLEYDWYNPQVWYVMGREIHRSRIPTMVGRPVPDLLKPSYAFGGLSLSQIMKPYVDIWLTTRQSIGDLIHAFSQMVLLTDLNTILQSPAGVTNLMGRAALFNATRDNAGLMLLNKSTEDLKNVTTPLSGLHELQAQSQEHMLSVSRIPAVKAFGIQPQGLNASSEGEMRAWNDTIKAAQHRLFKPTLDYVIDLCQLTLWGEKDPDIVYQFESLVELTEKERGELRKANAEAGKIHIETGVIDPAEERRRIIADVDSQYDGLDPDALPEPPEPDEGEGGDDPFGAKGGEGEGGADNDNDGGTELSVKIAPKKKVAPGGAQDADPFGLDSTWNEADHPRAPDGKFGSGGGSGAGGAEKRASGHPSPEKQASGASAPLDLKGLKRVGKQMGSNPGGVFEDADGTRFYVKQGKSKEHVANELAAVDLAKLAGVPTLDYRPVKGGAHIASKMEPLDKNRASQLSPQEVAQAQKDFVAHAWLANWDAIGTGGDNIGTIAGVPTSLDLGGALIFRAQGAPKGQAFGPKVGELETMRNPQMSPDAARIYGGMTEADMAKSARKVLAIKDDAIRDVIKQRGLPEAVADTLIARKEYLAKRFGGMAGDEAIYQAALDEAPFDESKHKRDADGKFTSTGGGGSSGESEKKPSFVGEAIQAALAEGKPSKVFKTKKEHIGYLLTEGTTVAEVLKATGWPAVSMPQQAAALGMKLEKIKKNGQWVYKGVPMTDAEKAAAKTAKKPKAEAPAPPPAPEPAKPAPSPLPMPSAEELKKAAKATTFPVNTTAPEGVEAIKAFNEKYANKPIDASNKPALIQKVHDFKAMQAKVAAANADQVAKQKAEQAEAQKKQQEAAKKAAEELEKKKKAELDEIMSDPDSKAAYLEMESVTHGHGFTDDFVKKATKAFEDSSYKNVAMSGVEKSAIVAYTGSKYRAINASLRQGVMTKDQYAFTKALNQGLSKLPNYKGTVYRKADLTPQQAALYQPGMIVEERAFTSTSKSSGIWSGSYHYEIESLTGKDVQPLSQHKNEQEVLFRSGSRFEVISVSGNKIKMKEVPIV